MYRLSLLYNSLTFAVVIEHQLRLTFGYIYVRYFNIHIHTFRSNPCLCLFHTNVREFRDVDCINES